MKNRSTALLTSVAVGERPTALDAAGDRANGNYDYFWTIQDVEGTQQWVRTAQFVGGHLVR